MAAARPRLLRSRRPARSGVPPGPQRRAGVLDGGLTRGAARAAPARRRAPLPDRARRAIVAALRQAVDRGSAAPTRAARQLPGSDPARRVDRSACAARSLALASYARDRRTAGAPCRRRPAACRPIVRRAPEGLAPPPRSAVGERRRGGPLIATDAEAGCRGWKPGARKWHGLTSPVEVRKASIEPARPNGE